VPIPVVIDLLVLLQNLVTDDELSVADLLPLPVHLGLDVPQERCLPSRDPCSGSATRA
jgi:hypothetical protein